MTKDTNKIKKLKRAGAMLALAGGLALGAGAMMQNTDDPVAVKENKEYLKKLERDANKMTAEQKLLFIQGAEETLDKLQKKIDSDKTNPEERFEARRSRNLIQEEIRVMQKSLDRPR